MSNAIKKKHQALTKFPGITKVLTKMPGAEKFEEPKRGKKFRVSKSVNGVRVRKYFENFVDAKAFWIGNPLPVTQKQPASGMTFHDLVEKWQEDWLPSKNDSTAIRYRSYLKHFQFFYSMPVESIETNTIDKWLKLIKTVEYLKNSHATRCDYRHEFSVLRLILNYYVSRFNRSYRLPFIADHRSMLKVRQKMKRTKDLSVDEFKRFIQALKKVCVESNQEAIYFLGLMQYATYTRVQEVAALSYEDFDFDHEKVHVRKKVQWLRAKGFEDRIEDGSKANGGKVIPMSQIARQAFNEWTIKSGVRSGPLFQLKGKLITYRQIGYRYSQALKLAGLPFTATHILRHASLTEFYDSCKDLLQTAKVAGHGSLRSTETYAKVRSERVVQTQKLMDQKLNGVLDPIQQTGTDGHHLQLIKE